MRAISAFEDLRDHFKTSTLCDDAQAEIARAHLIAGEPAKACAALKRLARDFASSRHNRQRAAELRTQAGCH